MKTSYDIIGAFKQLSFIGMSCEDMYVMIIQLCTVEDGLDF